MLNDFYDSRWFSQFRMILFSSLIQQSQSNFITITQQSIELSLSFLWPIRNELIMFDFLSQSQENERLIVIQTKKCFFAVSCAKKVFCRNYVTFWIIGAMNLYTFACTLKVVRCCIWASLTKCEAVFSDCPLAFVAISKIFFEAAIEFRKAYSGLEKMDSDLINYLKFQQFASDDYAVHYYRQVSYYNIVVVFVVAGSVAYYFRGTTKFVCRTVNQ